MTVIFYAIINLLIGATMNTAAAPTEAIITTQEVVILPAEIIPTENKPESAEPKLEDFNLETNIPEVPFYSQFSDISAPEWKKIGCGIADAAMIINYYKPGAVSVDELLKDGISSGAFITGAGWSHKGLASLFDAYGLAGKTYDLSGLNKDSAFLEFAKQLENGPAIASVHYKFDPQNPIPHLVVITGVKDGSVYYNDPANSSGGKTISISEFNRAWKKRFITASL